MTKGLPYFPLDCQLNVKIALIEAEFGLTGFAVIVKLFQRIYGQQGYYCEFTKEVALLFAKEIGLGGNVVSEIVSASVQRGIFDVQLYEKYHILTSCGIQERYFEAVSRRKKVEVKNEYLLLKYADIPKNVIILGKNADIFQENADISKQRKGEESIGEYRRGEDASAKPPPTPPPTQQKQNYGQYKHVSLTDIEYSELVSEYGKRKITEYIKRMDDHIQGIRGGKPYSDCNVIIRKWLDDDGVKKLSGTSELTDDSPSYDLSLMVEQDMKI